MDSKGLPRTFIFPFDLDNPFNTRLNSATDGAVADPLLLNRAKVHEPSRLIRFTNPLLDINPVGKRDVLLPPFLFINVAADSPVMSVVIELPLFKLQSLLTSSEGWSTSLLCLSVCVANGLVYTTSLSNS